jgi:hypothetical protein
MTFADWQALDPTPAAREFLRRATTLIPPAQQRAVFAHLPTEAELVTHFATAPAADLTIPTRPPVFAGETVVGAPALPPPPPPSSARFIALRGPLSLSRKIPRLRASAREMA